MKALAGALSARGAQLVNPLQGLQIGYQLQWYDRLAGGPAARHRAVPSLPHVDPGTRAPGDGTDATRTTVGSTSELEPFDYRWPAGVEHFTHGWDYTVEAGDQSFRVRHGIGGRDVYGRFRVHSVTWIDGKPMVEGVAPDDYDDSGALLSLLRIAGRAHVRKLTDLPLGYAGFTVVRHSDEIVAKHSPRGLAIKILEDDLAAWARHAILRAQSKGSDAAPDQGYRKARLPRPSTPHTLPLPPDLDQAAIIRALLAYADTARAAVNKGGGEAFFTPNPEANHFLFENPFAFLLAVIFDQGIVAERAWAAPYELRRRLGHLDPARIVAEPNRVGECVSQPPKLQRFINTIPRWVVAASKKVISEYGGDAGRIWSDRPTADDLERRLDAFPGIGQKKAAMAVEILQRHLKVEIRELQQTDIAYDIHVRRVFLRTGLADHDDRDHMIQAGRRLNPARPGAIDSPMWLIGRGWCSPGVPLCPDCPLFAGVHEPGGLACAQSRAHVCSVFQRLD